MPPTIAPLLSTKLYIPQARSNLVSRPRLLALLTAGQAQPLTLILAPPGSGKTTVLCDWISSQRRRVAWLALDAGDNDPVRFWSIFIASLQTAQENLGVEALALLRTSPTPAWDIVVSLLLNDLAAVPDPFVCVLEDYHCINQDLIHAALAFLIDHQPENMRLIITSRSDPPLPVARWRMRHQLVEIRAEDLRFTLGEARDFLIRTMKLRLSSRDVAALEERTEGWIAGLQLAALSLQGQPDAAACIAAFSGQHRYVADYLFEEVVKCLPVEIQSFLVQTCLLDRLCGSLCAAVLDQPDSAGVLRQLEQMNLFIIPLDTERQWYRYHSLFAEFLRQQLGQRYPDHSALLHRRTSLWHEQQGFNDEAIGHALAARDFDRAAALIQTSAEDWIRQGEVTTLLDRLAALPDQIICAKPELCTWQAWALTLSHQLTQVEPWLHWCEVRFLEMKHQAEQNPEHSAALWWSYRVGYGQVLAIRATVAEQLKDHAAAIAYAAQALDVLPPNDPILLSAMELTLGQAYLAQGNAAAAATVLMRAVEDSHTARHSYIHFYALLEHANAQAALKHGSEARALYQEAVRFAQDTGLTRLGQISEQALAELIKPESVNPLNQTEPLNAREIEILQLLACGASNQIIADQLVLAVSTVRWYLKQIYRKLGVHNRTAAIHRARSAGFL